MSIASTFATVAANTGAYTKHAVLTSGLHSSNFARELVSETKAQYAAKDAELEQRRVELRAARIAQAATLPAPKRRTQRKLAV